MKLWELILGKLQLSAAVADIVLSMFSAICWLAFLLEKFILHLFELKEQFTIEKNIKRKNVYNG